MDRTSGQPKYFFKKPEQLPLPGEALVWKIDGKAVKLLMMTFSNRSICYLFCTTHKHEVTLSWNLTYDE